MLIVSSELCDSQMIPTITTGSSFCRSARAKGLFRDVSIKLAVRSRSVTVTLIV